MGMAALIRLERELLARLEARLLELGHLSGRDGRLTVNDGTKKGKAMLLAIILPRGALKTLL